MRGWWFLAAVMALAAVLAPGSIQAQTDPAVAQLNVRLQALEEQVAKLVGELETARFRQDQMERTIGDLRAQLTELGNAPRGPRTGAAAPTTGGTPTVNTGRPSSPRVASIDPEAAASFELGMAAIRDGRFDQGRSHLIRYAEANPDEPRAAEASYWAAETLYVQQDFQGAAAAFATNYRTYGANALRAPDTLLKLGMSLRAMGDNAKACRTLDELASRHPDLPSSVRAASTRERERAGCN